jgi:CBS domain-containing protein
VDLKQSLRSETVEAAHPAEPLTVELQTSLADVFTRLKQHRVGEVLVCQAGKLVGIFTERDALRVMAGGEDLSLPVERFMATQPVTMRVGESVASAIRRMSLGGYRRLPIVDEQGRPVGVTRVSGIVRFLVEHFPKTVYNLPPDPQPLIQEREGA